MSHNDDREEYMTALTSAPTPRTSMDFRTPNSALLGSGTGDGYEIEGTPYLDAEDGRGPGGSSNELAKSPSEIGGDAGLGGRRPSGLGIMDPDANTAEENQATPRISSASSPRTQPPESPTTARNSTFGSNASGTGAVGGLAALGAGMRRRSTGRGKALGDTDSEEEEERGTVTIIR